MPRKNNVRMPEEDQTIANRILKTLKWELINGALAPGSVIVEAQVGARFGVSKTPAREALVRLSDMGFVTVLPGKGYTVTKLSWQQVKDLLENRTILEVAAAELAAIRAGPGDIKAMKAAAVLPLKKDISIEELIDANLQFHRLMWQATRNAHLAQLLNGIMNDLTRTMHTAMLTYHGEEMAKEHLTISKLIEERRGEEIRGFMATHIDATRRRILDL